MKGEERREGPVMGDEETRDVKRVASARSRVRNMFMVELVDGESLCVRALIRGFGGTDDNGYR